LGYSEKYLQHFSHPVGVGEFDPYDAIGQVEHEGGGCFDRIKLTLIINDGEVADLRFRARACSGTIAACSALVEYSAGKSISELIVMKSDDLANVLGGIPENKQHSVELAIKALSSALDQYKRSAKNRQMSV